MSDTPRTDALTKSMGELGWSFTALRDHAHTLERENTALREALQDMVYLFGGEKEPEYDCIQRAEALLNIHAD